MTERDIAEFLVGSIDDMGYIRRSILILSMTWLLRKGFILTKDC
jgi:DNA-directed RNA polymerase specialized sigma54-like protein